MGDRTPDECIASAWEIANGNPGYCEPYFKAFCDQWWGVVIDCEHGKFKGESRGQIDISTAFRSALAEYQQGHPGSTATIPNRQETP